MSSVPLPSLNISIPKGLIQPIAVRAGSSISSPNPLASALEQARRVNSVAGSAASATTNEVDDKIKFYSEKSDTLKSTSSTGSTSSGETPKSVAPFWLSQKHEMRPPIASVIHTAAVTTSSKEKDTTIKIEPKVLVQLGNLKRARSLIKDITKEAAKAASTQVDTKTAKSQTKGHEKISLATLDEDRKLRSNFENKKVPSKEFGHGTFNGQLSHYGQNMDHHTLPKAIGSVDNHESVAPAAPKENPFASPDLSKPAKPIPKDIFAESNEIEEQRNRELKFVHLCRRHPKLKEALEKFEANNKSFTDAANQMLKEFGSVATKVTDYDLSRLQSEVKELKEIEDYIAIFKEHKDLEQLLKEAEQGSKTNAETYAKLKLKTKMSLNTLRKQLIVNNEFLALCRAVPQLNFFLEPFEKKEGKTVFKAAEFMRAELAKNPFTVPFDVDLSKTGITSLPPEMRKLKMKSLNLSGLKIDFYPEWLGKCVELEEVNLSNCGLTYVPGFISHLPNLLKLDLGKNNLVELPKWFGNLRNLKFLHLNENRFSKFPEPIGLLRRLQLLNMESNQLQKLSPVICTLEFLTELNLSLNQLKKLPENSYGWQQLHTLYLNGNHFKEFPKELTELPRLEALHVENNDFNCFGTRLDGMTALKSIYFDHHKFNSVPDFLYGLDTKPAAENKKASTVNEEMRKRYSEKSKDLMPRKPLVISSKTVRATGASQMVMEQIIAAPPAQQSAAQISNAVPVVKAAAQMTVAIAPEAVPVRNPAEAPPRCSWKPFVVLAAATTIFVLPYLTKLMAMLHPAEPAPALSQCSHITLTDFLDNNSVS